jgi:hypothetical protein
MRVCLLRQARSAPAYPGARGGEAIARVLFGEFNHQRQAAIRVTCR